MAHTTHRQRATVLYATLKHPVEGAAQGATAASSTPGAPCPACPHPAEAACRGRGDPPSMQAGALGLWLAGNPEKQGVAPGQAPLGDLQCDSQGPQVSRCSFYALTHGRPCLRTPSRQQRTSCTQTRPLPGGLTEEHPQDQPPPACTEICALCAPERAGALSPAPSKGHPVPRQTDYDTSTLDRHTLHTLKYTQGSSPRIPHSGYTELSSRRPHKTAPPQGRQALLSHGQLGVVSSDPKESCRYLGTRKIEGASRR